MHDRRKPRKRIKNLLKSSRIEDADMAQQNGLQDEHQYVIGGNFSTYHGAIADKSAPCIAHWFSKIRRTDCRLEPLIRVVRMLPFEWHIKVSLCSEVTAKILRRWYRLIYEEKYAVLRISKSIFILHQRGLSKVFLHDTVRHSYSTMANGRLVSH